MNTKTIIFLTSTALSLLAFVTYSEEMHMKEAIKYAHEAEKASHGKVDARVAELMKIHGKAKKAT